MKDRVKLVLTVGVLSVALYLIVFRPHDHDAQAWSFEVVGILMGWLKPKPPSSIFKKRR
jgi:hypothetical protein